MDGQMAPQDKMASLVPKMSCEQWGHLFSNSCIYLPYWYRQKYRRLRCSLHVKGLVLCFYLGWSGSILQFRQNIIKVGSKSWLFTCSSNVTLSLPSYTGSDLKRELNFWRGYLSLLYFCLQQLRKCKSYLGNTNLPFEKLFILHESRLF